MLNVNSVLASGGDFPTGLIAVIIAIVILLIIIASCIKIVPQAQAFVIERLGGYKETWSVGLHFKMPILDKVA